MDFLLILELFWTFFCIGLFTFGGGYAMLPLIQAEVLKHGWLTEGEIVDFIAVSESTPGPFAINMATYVGIETAGPLGAVATTLGVVLPSLIVIMIVAVCYEKFKKARSVQAGLMGIRPVAIGLIASAVISVGKAAFYFDGMVWQDLLTPSFLAKILLFALLVFLAVKKVKPIKLILLSAGLGIVIGYLLEFLKLA